ncbi:flagellar basal body P-ring formation chaperone FlgA [Bosea vaviloviae]|uniref:Flagella basal body P-ring formation protein FlgA n=1 Tax=Bosea vaviloviae TaxID=1526658 RepID=A0A1D7TVX6_9HYPH|nr:flagellar basal body P-ring formation chaperone FlgA [Bosea vaviloviae]AOO79273.1 flagella basal body P-ring formation protein FlgA [Bosea vaviloviae]
MTRVPARSSLLAATLFCLGASCAQAAPGDVMLPVPVVTLYPGDVITDSHLVDRAFRLAMRASVDNRLALVGKVARRTLLPGQPIPINAVDDAKIVRRGVPTQVVFRESEMVITGIVEPLQSASVNEMVKARNPDTGLTVIGVVQANGTIRVGGE